MTRRLLALALARRVGLPETAHEPRLRRVDVGWVLSVPVPVRGILLLETHYFAETADDLRCLTGTVVPRITTATTPEEVLALIEAAP